MSKFAKCSSKLSIKRKRPQNRRHACILCSVADPEPDQDPVGYGLIGSPESGSGKIPDPDPLATKRPL